jgi:hypothetical protein
MQIVRTKKMRLSLAIILLFAYLGAVTAEERWRYQLSDKAIFENEIDSHNCEKLTVDNQFVGWVNGLAEVGTSLIFRLCIKEELPYEGAASEGAIYGGVDSGWYELRKTKRLKPEKLILPKMNDFSNPSYCGSYIAYWGAGGNHSYYAMVYHFGKRILLKDHLVGRSILETDNMYVLNPPKWSKDCTSVIFGDNHFKQKVTFRF